MTQQIRGTRDLVLPPPPLEVSVKRLQYTLDDPNSIIKVEMIQIP